MKNHVQFMFCACLLILSATAKSQSGAPQTPAGVLARSAGTLLGSLEYMRVFKSTDCGYALSRTFPSLNQALVSEVIPAFPPEARNEVARSMQEIRSDLSRDANKYVKEILTAAKQDHDKNTACGLIAGNLASVYGRAYEAWSVNKTRYGWKAR